nr:hypothetical protein [Cryobacterium algoricola]
MAPLGLYWTWFSFTVRTLVRDAHEPASLPDEQYFHSIRAPKATILKKPQMMFQLVPRNGQLLLVLLLGPSNGMLGLPRTKDRFCSAVGAPVHVLCREREQWDEEQCETVGTPDDVLRCLHIAVPADEGDHIHNVLDYAIAED